MLRLHNVAMTYPSGIAAILPTSISVPKGQFLVLLGPSGAGKSTLLRCMNGLVTPTQGDVIVDGRGFDFPERPRAARAPPAHRNDFPAASSDRPPLGAPKRSTRPRQLRTAPCGPCFRCLGRTASSLCNRSNGLVCSIARSIARIELSGGQQQRIGIARAMAQRPRIVLADEPVASLDPATGEKVLADLHRICREDGITAIVSLHQVDLARRFADRVIGLAGGRIVFEGTASQLGQTILDQIYSTASAANGSGLVSAHTQRD